MSAVRHQEYLDTVYTAIGICHSSSFGVCWQTPTELALRVYIVEILLMVGSGLVRNMYSTLSNKSKK